MDVSTLLDIDILDEDNELTTVGDAIFNMSDEEKEELIEIIQKS